MPSSATEKYFVSRVNGSPRVWGIFHNTLKGWKLDARYNSKSAAEDECEEWNYLASETDSRVLQMMGWC